MCQCPPCINLLFGSIQTLYPKAENFWKHILYTVSFAKDINIFKVLLFTIFTKIHQSPLKKIMFMVLCTLAHT